VLKQRVITAIVLLAILLPALFWPSPTPFTAVVLVLIAGGAWEWGRLNGLGPGLSIAVAAICLALCAQSWYAGLLDRPLGATWTIAGAVWVLGGAFLLRDGVAGWPRIPRWLRLVEVRYRFGLRDPRLHLIDVY